MIALEFDSATPPPEALASLPKLEEAAAEPPATELSSGPEPALQQAVPAALPTPDREQFKQIGSLAIPIPLFNIYLTEADELSRRLTRIFLRDAHGRRPVFGGAETFQHDPHWRDLLLFYEYFHGDDGAGIGASHQTGWTALVAKLLQQSGG